MEAADCCPVTWSCCACRGELYPCETGVRLCDELETDEEVEVDMESDVLTVLRTGKQYPLTPIGDVSPHVLKLAQRVMHADHAEHQQVAAAEACWRCKPSCLHR